MDTPLIVRFCKIFLTFIIMCYHAKAQKYQFIERVCWPDLLLVEEIPIPGFDIPIGCELIDCCPGCPGPGIDLRIKVDDNLPIHPFFSFKNLDSSQIKALEIKGDAKFDGENLLHIGGGETIISEFKTEKGVKLPLITMNYDIDQDALKKMGEQMELDNTADETAMEIIIEQYMGDFIVNRISGLFIVKWKCTGIKTAAPIDTIDLNNNTANDNAVVLVDARTLNVELTCINDQSFRGDNIINVGNLWSNSNCQSEVTIFSDDNAVGFFSNVTEWTNAGGDHMAAPLNPLLQVPVTVWLNIGGNATLARAQNDIANANLLFNVNHAGVVFNAVFNDVSGNQQAGQVIGTSTAACQPLQINNLTGSNFFTPGQLNVYYVNSAFTGFNCTANPNIVFVGTTANNQTLAHEFGHSFSIGHTENVAGISAQNVMIGGGANRTNFTEGQDFRMNLDPASSLNTNGIRNGPTRNCPDGTTSGQCPALILDITPN